MYEKESAALLEVNLAQPALDQCLKAGHVFNVMEARGVISVTERTLYISRIRNLSSKCCALWAAGSE